MLIHSHPPNAARECDQMVRLRDDLAQRWPLTVSCAVVSRQRSSAPSPSALAYTPPASRPRPYGPVQPSHSATGGTSPPEAPVLRPSTGKCGQAAPGLDVHRTNSIRTALLARHVFFKETLLPTDVNHHEDDLHLLIPRGGARNRLCGSRRQIAATQPVATVHQQVESSGVLRWWDRTTANRTTEGMQ